MLSQYDFSEFCAFLDVVLVLLGLCSLSIVPLSHLCSLLSVTSIKNVVFMGAPYFLLGVMWISSDYPAGGDGREGTCLTCVFLVIVPGEAAAPRRLVWWVGPPLVRLHLKLEISSVTEFL